LISILNDGSYTNWQFTDAQDLMVILFKALTLADGLLG
jgi:hypothetical protein